jgi:hypothetical protein
LFHPPRLLFVGGVTGDYERYFTIKYFNTAHRVRFPTFQDPYELQIFETESLMRAFA